MSESDKFALVPKVPGPIKKSEPRTRRILSGIIEDTLELAKKEPPRKALLFVLTCIGDKDVAEVWKVIIRKQLGELYDVSLIDRYKEPEIVEVVQQRSVDLIVAMVNNIVIPASDTEDRVTKAVALLTRLKAEYGIPIIALSGFKSNSFDLPERIKQGGIDAFLWAPFELAAGFRALEACGVYPHWTRQKPSPI